MILKPFFSSHWWQAICPYPWVYKSSSKNDPNIHTLHKPLHIEELYLLVCHYEPNQPWNKSWDYHTPMGAFDTAFFVIIIINALIHIMWGWNWKAQCFMLTFFIWHSPFCGSENPHFGKFNLKKTMKALIVLFLITQPHHAFWFIFLENFTSYSGKPYFSCCPRFLGQ